MVSRRKGSRRSRYVSFSSLCTHKFFLKGTQIWICVFLLICFTNSLQFKLRNLQTFITRHRYNLPKLLSALFCFKMKMIYLKFYLTLMGLHFCILVAKTNMEKKKISIHLLPDLSRLYLGSREWPCTS